MPLNVFALLPKNASAYYSISISEADVDGDGVTEIIVENAVLNLTFTRQGARPIRWTVKETGLELAANAGDRGPMAKSYPLYDWIPNLDWPGNTTLDFYSFRILENPGPYAKIRFSDVLTQEPVAGLNITKTFTIYADKFYLEMEILLKNPTDAPIEISATFDQRIGYALSWCGIIGTDKANDFQSWRIGVDVSVGKKESWIRHFASDLKWIVIYDLEEGGMGGIVMYNTTFSLWNEAGPWGTEVRTEMPSITIQPYQGVTYVFRAFGGPLDPKVPDTLNAIKNAGFEGLVEKLILFVDIDVDKYSYEPADNSTVTILLQNNLGEPLRNIYINLSLYTWHKEHLRLVTRWDNQTIEGLTTTQYSHEFNITEEGIPEGIYLLQSEVLQNQTTLGIASTPFVVVSTKGRSPVILNFVYNHHQPWYKNLDGVYELQWAQYYVEEGNQPYLYHVKILRDHPNIHVTFNLQPSLLAQWVDSIDGYDFLDPATGYVRKMPASSLINETLNGYIDLVNSKQIEVITSPFYHPLLAILVERGWERDALNQLLLGKAYTQKVMGITPNGTWSPEMAFGIEVIPILAQAGIKYTALDPAHLPNSSLSIYEPYVLKDPETGKEISVFFRNKTISNLVSFQLRGYINAKTAARDFIVHLYSIYISDPTKTKVVTIAIDGENPIVGGNREFFDKIYESVDQLDWLDTETMGELLKTIPPQKVLTNINTTSWTGSFDQWAVEEADLQLYDLIDDVRARVLAFENAAVDGQVVADTLKTAWNYTYTAQTSDYFYWPGRGWFYFQGVRYCEAARDVIDQQIENIQLQFSPETPQFIPLKEVTIEVVVKNNATFDFNLTISLQAMDSGSIEFIEEQEKETLVGAEGVTTVAFKIKALQEGPIILNVTASSLGVIFTEETLTVIAKKPAEVLVPPIVVYGVIVAVAIVIAATYLVTRKRKSDLLLSKLNQTKRSRCWKYCEVSLR